MLQSPSGGLCEDGYPQVLLGIVGGTVVTKRRRNIQSNVQHQEIYPAPFISDAVPMNEVVLRELIEKDSERADCFLALGNLLLHEQRFSEAVACYRQALIAEPNIGEVLCNMAVALGAQARLGKAVGCLKRAVLVQPNLTLAHLWLARFSLRRGDDTTAQAAFVRMLELDAEHEEALTELGALSEAAGDRGRAEHYYRRALAAGRNSRQARCRLAYFEFLDGVRLFEQGRLDEALKFWAELHAKSPEPFVDEPDIVRSLKKAVAEYSSAGQLDEIVRDASTSKANEKEYYYALVTRLLFSLGLFPEMFVPPEMAAEETRRWEEALGREGDPPYPHYRLGLLLAQSGDIDRAVTELRLARDLLKGKKIEQLRLNALLDFFQSLQSRLRLGVDQQNVAVGDEEWVGAGFSNKLEIRVWKRIGLPPVESFLWREKGFTPREAKVWSKEKISPGEASIWKEHGVEEPKEARQWSKGEVPPAEVALWRKSFTLPVGLALQCRNVGLTDPAEAYEWMQVFQFPGDAVTWRDVGFRPAEAVIWLGEGVTDPFQALEHSRKKK